MSKKRKSPYVRCEGRLYVDASAIMTPFIVVFECLPCVFFSGKGPFLAIDDAIEWCRNEMKYHSHEKYQQMIDAMETMKRQ